MLVYAKIITWDIAYENLSDEDWQELRNAIPLLGETKPKYGWENALLLDFDAIMVLAKFKLTIELSDKNHSMFVKMKDKFMDKNIPEALVDGSMVQIHVPDMGLLLMNEVKHLDDCCTDVLQEALNDGWKILAVCPPNSQRRPDYILGRRK